MDSTSHNQPSAKAWAARKWVLRFLFLSFGILGLGIFSIPLGISKFKPALYVGDLFFRSSATPPYLGFLLSVGLVLLAVMFWLLVLAICFARFSLATLLGWYLALAGCTALVFYFEDAEKAFPATFLGFMIIKLVSDLLRNDPGIKREVGISNTDTTKL